MSALAYGVIAMRDAGIIESALYWILLGIVIFVSVVIGGLALARAVPLVRGPIVWWLDWLAEKTQKTKTRAEVEKGFWGKLVNRVMKRPGMFALPIVIVMTILIIPLGQLALGGISEKYLPPDNSVRQAQEEFDRTFPGFRTEPLTLVIESTNGQPVTDQQIAEVRNKAMQIPGFIEPNNDPSNDVEGTLVPGRRNEGPVGPGDPERPRQRATTRPRRSTSCGRCPRRAV